MRLTAKATERLISEIAGEDVVPLVKALGSKKNVSELKLAEEIKQEINLTRNMLYRLYDNNLVQFTRKKDKKKGWYIYYWTFNNNRLKDMYKQLKMKRYNMLKERLEREESTQFYTCKNKCMRMDFEKSSTREFKCPECGELLDTDDNTRRIKILAEETEKLEKELKKLK